MVNEYLLFTNNLLGSNTALKYTKMFEKQDLQLKVLNYANLNKAPICRVPYNLREKNKCTRKYL